VTEEPGDRLQKVLAQAGVGSRRSCEELIVAGRVRVNGRVAVLGQRARAAVDHISVDGVPLPVREGMAYYLVNKPVGVVCTAQAQDARQIVVDLVPASPRVYPVGRLDADSEGLMVLTNDGELAQVLSHPSHGVEKEYVVRVSAPFSSEGLRHLRRGVELEDGRTAPARAHLLGPDAARIIVHEGRNRQVRRMCEAVGSPVTYLARVRIGPVSSPDLLPGQWRHLETAEVTALFKAATGQTGERGRRQGRS
jgi:23S rRNA pseudouridine2605 synthase